MLTWRLGSLTKPLNSQANRFQRIIDKEKPIDGQVLLNCKSRNFVVLTREIRDN